jgi:hypothetical protein
VAALVLLLQRSHVWACGHELRARGKEPLVENVAGGVDRVESAVQAWTVIASDPLRGLGDLQFRANVLDLELQNAPLREKVFPSLHPSLACLKILRQGEGNPLGHSALLGLGAGAFHKFSVLFGIIHSDGGKLRRRIADGFRAAIYKRRTYLGRG